MLIYSKYNSTRLVYASEIVLEDYVGKVTFTDDAEFYKQYGGVKMEYNFKQEIEYSFFIPANPFLWNDKIEQHEINYGTWHDLVTLYPAEGSVPFDIFSATFYLISRYEEYLPFSGDKMNRFEAKESLAHKLGFLRSPIIDQWRCQFHKTIKDKWPQIEFKARQFRFTSTIDVDSAFAFKHKGFKRTMGAIAKDLVGCNFVNLYYRIMTLIGALPDVYNTYDYIHERCKVNRVRNIYFFLLANFGQYDKNVPHTSRKLRALIKKISNAYSIGIHPGVASNNSLSILKKEKHRLESISEAPCKIARQHYLMLRFPATYRNYIAVGIEEDYTMGFAEDVGFRAGTSRPFYWFDLEKNEKTYLRVFPFIAMDTTLKNYLKLTTAEAKQLTDILMKEVMATQGDFIALWHNESLSESKGWQGWRDVWEHTLKQSVR